MVLTWVLIVTLQGGKPPLTIGNLPSQKYCLTLAKNMVKETKVESYVCGREDVLLLDTAKEK